MQLEKFAQQGELRTGERPQRSAPAWLRRVGVRIDVFVKDYTIHA